MSSEKGCFSIFSCVCKKQKIGKNEENFSENKETQTNSDYRRRSAPARFHFASEPAIVVKERFELYNYFRKDKADSERKLVGNSNEWNSNDINEIKQENLVFAKVYSKLSQKEKRYLSPFMIYNGQPLPKIVPITPKKVPARFGSSSRPVRVVRT